MSCSNGDKILRPEPFRIKVVERVSLLPFEERKRVIKKAGFNPFLIPSRDVFVDLLSDSGTCALSNEQLSILMLGDESFSSQRGYFYLIEKVKEITGFDYVIPCHQGRGAENILMDMLVKKEGLVVSNGLFETTRAHIEMRGGEGIDLPTPRIKEEDYLFKGDISLRKLRNILKSAPKKVNFILITLTNNSQGGRPVSIHNLRKVREIADEFRKPVVLDASRFAENAYFIYKHELPGKSIRAIVREMFSLSDIFYLSAKKNGLSHSGAIIGVKSRRLYENLSSLTLFFEGFPSHGGLPDRDLLLIAKGLEEIIDEEYLAFRIEQVKFLGEKLREAGIPVLYPFGGHAVYIDAEKLLSHFKNGFPGYAFASEVYVEGGVRVGVFGGKLSGGGTPEYVRLAIPHRVYTNSHLLWVVDAVKRVVERKREIRELALSYSPPRLRTFLARFRQV